jgi:hypothetical protein
VAKHGIEGSCGNGIAMEHVKIGIIFIFDKLSKFFLNFCAEIFILRPLNTVIFEKLYTLGKSDTNYRKSAFKWCEFELLVDCFELAAKPLFNLAENVRE